MPLVSIIIPVYNNLSFTRRCINAILKAPPRIPFEIIVVDDASQDETPRYLEYMSKRYPFIVSIRNSKNSGFSFACNRGAEVSRGDYLVFLNNDTIPLPGWLDVLVKVAEKDKKIAIVGSKLLYPNGTIQHVGVLFRNFPFPLTPFHVYARKPSNLPAANVEQDYDAVTAACMLVKRSVFESMGGFDEQFVNGYEDVDFCLRAREAGYRVVYTPKSVLYHFESSTPGRFDYTISNVRILHNRWMGKVNYVFKKEPRVSVVILNYNGWSDTVEAISSIFMKEQYERFNIIVVDNASKVNESHMIEVFCRNAGRPYYKIDANLPAETALFKGEVFFKRLDANQGFGGGCNEGIKIALSWNADYVWLLNNDTLIENFALYYLVSLAEYLSNAAILGSKLHCYPDTEKVQFDGSCVAYRGVSEVNGKESIMNVSFVSGASMLIRTSFLRSCGLLREDYFLYFEDNEICQRALRNGYNVLYNPLSIVYHKGGSSIGGYLESPTSIYYAVRNSLFFYEEFEASRLLNTLNFVEHSLIPKLVSKDDTSGFEAAIQAVYDFLRNRKGQKGNGNKEKGILHASSWGKQTSYQRLQNYLSKLWMTILKDPYNFGTIKIFFDTARTLVNIRTNFRKLSS